MKRKKVWQSPKLVVHGSIEQITQDGDTKYKVDGDGDDVVYIIQLSDTPPP
jgi:hypothetical protein